MDDLRTGNLCDHQARNSQQYPPQAASILFVLSGPSGVGKDTVITQLKEELNLHFAVTVTTRSKRPGEVHGVNYFFASHEEFADLRRRDALLEWAVVHGNNYGTPSEQVRDALRGGKDVLLKIDVQGAAKVKLRVPEAVFIFLAPPNIEELTQRLNNRATESPEDRARRLCDARLEMEHLPEYDYVVVNYRQKVGDAVDRIRSIIAAEKCRVKQRRIEL